MALACIDECCWLWGEMWEQDCIEPHGVSVLHGVVTSVSVEAVIAHFIARNSKTSSMFVFQQMTPQ